MQNAFYFSLSKIKLSNFVVATTLKSQPVIARSHLLSEQLATLGHNIIIIIFKSPLADSYMIIIAQVLIIDRK